MMLVMLLLKNMPVHGGNRTYDLCRFGILAQFWKLRNFPTKGFRSKPRNVEVLLVFFGGSCMTCIPINPQLSYYPFKRSIMQYMSIAIIYSPRSQCRANIYTIVGVYSRIQIK
jgi:hypothetical protein